MPRGPQGHVGSRRVATGHGMELVVSFFFNYRGTPIPATPFAVSAANFPTPPSAFKLRHPEPAPVKRRGWGSASKG